MSSAVLTKSNTTGFKNVTFQKGRSRPYELQICQNGERKSLGTFATAEEAALEYARWLGSVEAVEVEDGEGIEGAVCVEAEVLPSRAGGRKRKTH